MPGFSSFCCRSALLTIVAALIAAAPAASARPRFFVGVNTMPHRGFYHDPFFERPFFYRNVPMTGYHLNNQLMYDLQSRPAMGRWNRMWYADRYGWWWNVGNNWYLYDQPVYPYPPTGLMPVYSVIGEPVQTRTQTIIVTPPANAVGTTEMTTGKILLPPPYSGLPAVQTETRVVIPAQTGSTTVANQSVQQNPASQVWYYCNDPKGYYPYVDKCPTGWSKVPARPADMP